MFSIGRPPVRDGFSYAEMVRPSRPHDVLAAHHGATVYEFPDGRVPEPEEEDAEPVPAPILLDPPAIPSDAEDQKAEEQALFVEATDDASGKLVYTAGRTLMGRNAAHTTFMLPTGPKGLPWSFLLVWDGSENDTLITLSWMGGRIEVRGRSLGPLYALIAMQRIAIWRCYDATIYAPPKEGDPIINSIRFVAAS